MFTDHVDAFEDCECENCLPFDDDSLSVVYEMDMPYNEWEALMLAGPEDSAW